MTQVWAHRGASAYAPENTLPAFSLAVEQGADGIELDVQRTLDGELVVIHDETINRTSNGFGRVVDLSLEQLRLCDFSNGFVGYRRVKIPTLRETLDLLRPSGMTINIELKNTIEPYPGMDLEAAALVAEAGLTDHTIFSSFNHVSLAQLRGVVPASQLGLLFTDGLYDPWRYAHWFGAGNLHPHHLLLHQPAFMWLCHEAGVAVNTWTVDDNADVARLAAMGVDAVVTNFPDRARRAVGRR